MLASPYPRQLETTALVVGSGLVRLRRNFVLVAFAGMTRLRQTHKGRVKRAPHVILFYCLLGYSVAILLLLVVILANF